MRGIMLGSLGGVPSKSEACSSFIITNNDEYMLVECGSGVTGALTSVLGDNKHKLKAIVISHLHFDHFNDLLTLNYVYKVAMRYGEVRDKIKVYLPERPSSIRHFLRNNLGDTFEFCNIQLGKEQEIISGVRVKFKETLHDVPTYAMRINDGHRTIGYTADTGYSDRVVKFLHGCDVLIAESSLLSKHIKNEYHMTALEAALMGKNAETSKLILTHFWYSESLLDYINEAKIIDDGIDIYTAKCGLII